MYFFLGIHEGLSSSITFYMHDQCDLKCSDGNLDPVSNRA